MQGIRYWQMRFEEEKDLHVGRMASLLWSQKFGVSLSSSSRSYMP
jgi:hypothetical protein